VSKDSFRHLVSYESSDTLPGRQEGEQLNTKVEGSTCCAGVERIAGTEHQDGGACVPVPPDLQICARCGNGTCGPGESPCNCPQDCR